MTALLLQFWPYIVGAIAVVFGLFKVQQSGVKAERLRQADREASARDIADQVDNDIGALPGSKAREELAKWGR